MGELTEAHKKKISKARYTLHQKHPFFAQIVQYLKPQPVKFISTMGVDANSNLYVNEDFLESLDEASTLWVLAHEAMHIVTMTSGRFPEGGDRIVFNIASDCSINMLITDDAGIQIIDEKIAKPIYGGHWAKYKGATTEAIYYDILKDPQKNLGMSLEQLHQQNGDGEEGDDGASSGGVRQGHLKGKWWDDSASKLGKKGQAKGMDANGNAQGQGGMTEEQKAQWKQRIASATAAAKAAGKMPGAIAEYVTTILEAKKDWRRELRSLAMTALRSRWTWKIPGRRSGNNLRTPGKERGVPIAICYIDTSGSQSDADIQRCLSETAKIFKICGGKGHLILGDSEIYFSGEMDAKNLANLPQVQRGGTDFRVLFTHIEETMKKKPSLLVGFTDCCGPFPDKAPSYPVIWCVPKSGSGNQDAPWGRQIEVEV
jgi:predicted metal-dependent peptidase